MYRETRVDSGGVVCTWERRSAGTGTALIVPDGCVDLVRYDDGRLEVAGPDTGPWYADVAVGRTIRGLRLAPGRARAVLGVPLSELRDQRVPIGELRPGAWPEPFASDPGFAQAEPDCLVLAAVRRLQQRPRTHVAQLADGLGVSVRHLHRAFVREVGYGPKLFGRVTRFQRFLDIARNTRLTLADAAHACGYSSQSHLSDEVRELTGTTPVRFLEDRAHPTP